MNSDGVMLRHVQDGLDVPDVFHTSPLVRSPAEWQQFEDWTQNRQPQAVEEWHKTFGQIHTDLVSNDCVSSLTFSASPWFRMTSSQLVRCLFHKDVYPTPVSVQIPRCSRNQPAWCTRCTKRRCSPDKPSTRHSRSCFRTFRPDTRCTPRCPSRFCKFRPLMACTVTNHLWFCMFRRRNRKHHSPSPTPNQPDNSNTATTPSRFCICRPRTPSTSERTRPCTRCSTCNTQTENIDQRNTCFHYSEDSPCTVHYR